METTMGTCTNCIRQAAQGQGRSATAGAGGAVDRRGAEVGLEHQRPTVDLQRRVHLHEGALHTGRPAGLRLVAQVGHDLARGGPEQLGARPMILPSMDGSSE